MKWAKTTKDLDAGNVEGPSRISFKEYDTIDVEVTNQGKKKARGKKAGKEDNILHEWATFNDLQKIGKRGKRKYEIFIGGYLYFYDERLSGYPEKIEDEFPKKFNGDKFGTDCINKLQKFFDIIGIGKKHEVYFEWNDDKIKKTTSVTIYIDPPAGNPDPPTPPPPPPPEINDFE